MTRKANLPSPRTWCIVLLAALVLVAPAAAKKSREASQGDDVIFEIADPRGDDHGNGQLVYPIRSDYEEGDLDLVSFLARRVATGTQFEATFAKRIRRADRQAIDTLGTSLESVARLGFYTFNIDVYIDRDRVPGSGALGLLPGRNAEVVPEHAWDRAVVLTPRPVEAKAALETMMLKALNQELRSKDYGDEARAEALSMRAALPTTIAERVFFPQQVRIHGNKVSFFVPDVFLGGVARDDWSYTVVVSGADLIQSFDLAASFGLAETTGDRLMILPVSPGRWQDRFGGGRDEEEMQPPIVDMIVPPGQVQERLLSDFDSRLDLSARLFGVVPAELEQQALGERGQGTPGR